MVVAMMLAGGKGIRAKKSIPKQFVQIQEKPIIVYTLETFQNNPLIDYIEVVCLKDYIDYTNELIKEYNLNKVKLVIEGGQDFQRSVINGLSALKDKLVDDDIVLIHSAVCPLVTNEIIDDSIDVCKKYGNSQSTISSPLLLSSNDGNMSKEYIERENVVQSNSPYCFKYKLITDLYEEAINKDLLDKVDPHPTSLLLYLNKPVYFSKGSNLNIKITTSEDFDLVESYILYKKGLLENK